MAPSGRSPNQLADIYDGLRFMLENLPDEANPLWEFAIESVLFGDEGLADDVECFGKQQADRNSFKMRDYRTRYGDGDWVTEFPAARMSRPLEHDRRYLGNGAQVPVTPQSETPLPLTLEEHSLEEALMLLNEFPARPGEEATITTQLLDPTKFPGLDDTNKSIQPNELAELYDSLKMLANRIPAEVHPAWPRAIETVMFPADAFPTDHQVIETSYMMQEDCRNSFSISEYRTEYGDGSRVTEFTRISTYTLSPTDSEYIEESVAVPIAPVSEEPLPLAPDESSIRDALALLQELPAWPQAESDNQDKDQPLVDIESLLDDVGESATGDASQAANETSAEDSSPPSDSEDQTIDSEQSGSEPTVETASEETSDRETKVVRQELPGERAASAVEETTRRLNESRKYEDPEAERAHRRAQQRDPAEVVALGEEYTLVLQEADYSSHPPTIMGTKQGLVVFVNDAPQDLSKHDTIRVKVVDYGGQKTSAQADFVGYTE